jgi:hypothetical protein
MKVSRTEFTAAIAMAAKITPNSATTPIFTSALIATARVPNDRDVITVSATDLETGLYLEVPYSGDPLPGAAACVHAKNLLKLLKTLDEADLELVWRLESPEKEAIPALLVNGIAIEVPANPADFPVLQTPTTTSLFRACIQPLSSACHSARMTRPDTM